MTESPPTLSTKDLFFGPPQYAPASAWGPISALLTTVVICGISIVSIFIAIIWAIATGTPPEQVQGVVDQMSSLATPTGFATALGVQLLSLGLCWLAAGSGGMRRESLRLASARPGLGLCLAAGAIALAVTSVAELLMYLTTAFNIFADTKWIVEGLRSPMWWGTVLIAIVFAPLWEELTFRGFLLSALAKTRLGIVGAGLISNFIWTALHAGYSWQGIVSVFLAGTVMTWLVWRTGSIWVPIAAHAIINTAALAFAYFLSPGV